MNDLIETIHWFKKNTINYNNNYYTAKKKLFQLVLNDFEK